MPPAALISLTASFTPSLKFVPDVVPVPDSSTSPAILIAWLCANSGCASARLRRNAEIGAMVRMGSIASHIEIIYRWNGRRTARNSRANQSRPVHEIQAGAIENVYRDAV